MFSNWTTLRAERTESDTQTEIRLFRGSAKACPRCQRPLKLRVRRLWIAPALAWDTK